MHELAICQNILSTIEEEMNDEVSSIREIHLRIGLLSCIEPEVLKQSFSFMKIDTAFEKADLYIEMIDVAATCEKCGNNFKVEKYKFVCPACEEPVSNVTAGNELLIYKIVLEQPSYAEINQ